MTGVFFCYYNKILVSVVDKDGVADCIVAIQVEGPVAGKSLGADECVTSGHNVVAVILAFGNYHAINVLAGVDEGAIIVEAIEVSQ